MELGLKGDKSPFDPLPLNLSRIMTFSGKELKDLGCPQNRIKFLIGIEFESEEAARQSFTQEKKEKSDDLEGTVFSFLRDLPRTWLPMDFRGEMPERMSNSGLRRLLESGGVKLNGQTPKPDDNFEFPIVELIFFPKSERKTTFIA